MFKKKFSASEWQKDVECTGKGNKTSNAIRDRKPCGAKINLTINDVFTTHNLDYAGKKPIHFTFKCPNCGSKTDLNDKELPREVKKVRIFKTEESVDKEKTKHTLDENENDM